MRLCQPLPCHNVILVSALHLVWPRYLASPPTRLGAPSSPLFPPWPNTHLSRAYTFSATCWLSPVPAEAQAFCVCSPPPPLPHAPHASCPHSVVSLFPPDTLAPSLRSTLRSRDALTGANTLVHMHTQTSGQGCCALAQSPEREPVYWDPGVGCKNKRSLVQVYVKVTNSK